MGFLIESSTRDHEKRIPYLQATMCYQERRHPRINEEEENLFMTQRTFDSFCSSCSNFLTLNSSILLTVVTAYGLNKSGLGNKNGLYLSLNCI